MNLRLPVVITSLEEDLKEIGLLGEDEVAEAKKSAKKAPKKEPECDECDEEPEDSEDSEEEEADESVESEEAEEPVEEASKRVTRTHRMSGADKARARLRKRSGKYKAWARKYGRKSIVKKLRKLHRRVAKLFYKGKKAGRKRLSFKRPGLQHATNNGKPMAAVSKMHTIGAGLDNVSNMVEGIRDQIETLDMSESSEAVKAFANVAIIADMLGEAFDGIGSALEEGADSDDHEDLIDMGEILDGLAESAAYIATALHEGEEADTAALTLAFKEHMDAVLDGISIYSELAEDDEEESDEDPQ